MVKVEVGQQWRNKKTGRVFTVASVGDFNEMVCSMDGSVIIPSNDALAANWDLVRDAPQDSWGETQPSVKQETPVQYVVIQPAATIYTTAEEAKAQAMRMAKTSGGVWAVGRVEGRAVAQPPAPVPPKWEDAPYGG